MRGSFGALIASFLIWAGPAHADGHGDSIPTLKSVVGHDFGEHITAPADVIAYFKALAKAAPKRMKLVEFGKSWEGRPLVYAVISSQENMEALDDIQSDMQRLATAALPTAEAKALIDDLPPPVWLSYGVHGNEISGSDAAIRTAYTLLSAENNETVELILGNTIVILDPMQNPDGRQRFVHDFYTTLGLAPSGSAIAAERKERWPNGRTNHYLFDMNRDWFALTQPETRARVKAFLDWYPVVFVDLHEMGTNNTYYFSPEAEPYNPYITQSQREGLLAIGKGNAAAFDEKGLEYYTREEYDAHYPGYGAGWPLFHGAVGTTYEQASARGLKADRDDGTTLTYADSVDGHFTTSIATLKTAAEKRQMFLTSFYENRKSAIALGRSDAIKAYVIPTQADQAGAGKLAGTLAWQGVTVREAETAFSACGNRFDKGTYIVPLDQPAGRLARTLLDKQVDVDPVFMKQQEARRTKGFSVEFYDVTAWSMPVMYNIDVVSCSSRPAVRSRAIMPRPEWKPPAGQVIGDGDFGYLVPWGNAAAVRVLSHALRQGIDVRSSDLAFSKDGKDYPGGTLIFQADRYDGDLEAAMLKITEETGANAYAMAGSWVDEGPNFGSENSVRHRAPNIAVAWDAPTSSYGAGNARFVIERQLGYPAVPVRVSDLKSDYLNQFDVLVLPEGSGYADALGKGGLKHLAGWTERGGVLITLGKATRLLSGSDGMFSALRLEERATGDQGEPPASGRVPARELADSDALEAAIAPDGGGPDFVLGSLLKATTEPDHWMAAGVKPTLNVLMEGSDIYAPLALDDGVTVARLAGPEDLLVSGYVWAEAKRQLAYKPAVTIEEKGRGLVIAFAQNPTTRAYLDGLNVLLANALFRAPAHAGKIR